MKSELVRIWISVDSFDVVFNNLAGTRVLQDSILQ